MTDEAAQFSAVAMEAFRTLADDDGRIDTLKITRFLAFAVAAHASASKNHVGTIMADIATVIAERIPDDRTH